MISYIVKSIFLAGRGSFQCELCGVELNRKHIMNECPYVEEERSRIRDLLGLGIEDRIIRLREVDDQTAEGNNSGGTGSG